MFSRSILTICSLLLVGIIHHAPAQEHPRYTIDLRFDLEAGELTGSATIDLPESAINNGSFVLDVSASNDVKMEVREVSSGSKALAHEELGSDGTLMIHLDDQPAKIRITYALPAGSSQLDPFGYFVFAEFGSSRYAYPEVLGSNNEPYRFSDFQVRLEYPSLLTVITSGGSGESRKEGNRTIAEYKEEHIEGFAIVAGQDFIVERHEADGVIIEAFFQPGYATRFEKIIDRTKEAAAWYRRTYGFFPLEQVSIIQGHPRWGGGYPLPNMFAIHLGNLEDEHLTWITAHELGHYYWGLYVLGDEERLDWLQLALGIWSDQQYLAERNGLSLAEQWRRSSRQGDWIADYLEAVVANHEQRLGIVGADEKSLAFDYNSLIRHGKAATGLYLQSQLIGPERFLDVQRQLLDTYKYRPLSEEDFVGLLQDAGSTDAAPFFEAWKQGDATIGLSIERVEQRDEGWQILLRRTGTVPYPVDVKAVSYDGVLAHHTVSAYAGRDTMRVPFAPEHVQLDPEGKVPMWNSSHPEMRAVYARALERAHLDEPFVVQAKNILTEMPDNDYLRYRLVRRLYLLARWSEVTELWPTTRVCENRDQCLTAIYSAQATAKMGDEKDAVSQLNDLQQEAERYGVLPVWRAALEEVRR